jgi:hypothetical protein
LPILATLKVSDAFSFVVTFCFFLIQPSLQVLPNTNPLTPPPTHLSSWLLQRSPNTTISLPVPSIMQSSERGVYEMLYCFIPLDAYTTFKQQGRTSAIGPGQIGEFFYNVLSSERERHL